MTAEQSSGFSHPYNHTLYIEPPFHRFHNLIVSCIVKSSSIFVSSESHQNHPRQSPASSVFSTLFQYSGAPSAAAATPAHNTLKKLKGIKLMD